MYLLRGIFHYTDVDECDTSMFDCIPEAQCVNTIGSYECTCLPGYSGNGTVCDGRYSIEHNHSVHVCVCMCLCIPVDVHVHACLHACVSA